MSDQDKAQKETMTAREVAEFFGVDRNDLFKQARTDPTFPKPFKPGAKSYYWLRSEVLAYREKQEASQND